MDLSKISTQELVKELQRRYVIPSVCQTCKRYTVSYKHYSGYGKAWHCDGCNKRVENCMCRR